MKKVYFYWFILLLILLFVTSCGKKPIQSKTEITNDTKISDQEKQILKEKLIVSLAIIDSLKSRVPFLKTGSNDKNCDSLCNEKFIDYLKSLNSSKVSGNNETGFYFDEINRMFVAYSKQGETVNHYKDSIYILNKEITRLKSDKTTIRIPELYIPKWCKILAAMGGFFLLYYLIRIIIFIKTKIPVS